MAQIVSFEDHALSRLRDRLGAAESARADLLAFAHGHSAASAAIHEAVLLALRADSAEALVASVVADWPLLLGVDCAVLCLAAGPSGVRIDRAASGPLDPTLLARGIPGIALTRSVERGHPLFGGAAAAIRAEALVPLRAPGLTGLLLLGQEGEGAVAATDGAELLEFLGAALGAMLGRWLTSPPAPSLRIPPAR